MTAEVWEGPVLFIFKITLGTNFRKKIELGALGKWIIKTISITQSHLIFPIVNLILFNCYLFSPLYDFYLMTAPEKLRTNRSWRTVFMAVRSSATHSSLFPSDPLAL